MAKSNKSITEFFRSNTKKWMPKNEHQKMNTKKWMPKNEHQNQNKCDMTKLYFFMFPMHCIFYIA
jgi:hypothetical protein